MQPNGAWIKHYLGCLRAQQCTKIGFLVALHGGGRGREGEREGGREGGRKGEGREGGRGEGERGRERRRERGGEREGEKVRSATHYKYITLTVQPHEPKQKQLELVLKFTVALWSKLKSESYRLTEKKRINN